VQIVERWILARLRNRRFFSLAELNEAIRALLAELNARPFKKLPGSGQAPSSRSIARRSRRCPPLAWRSPASSAPA